MKGKLFPLSGRLGAETLGLTECETDKFVLRRRGYSGLCRPAQIVFPELTASFDNDDADGAVVLVNG